MARKVYGLHARDHLPGGSDPIPFSSPGGFFEYRMDTSSLSVSDDTYTELSTYYSDENYNTATDADYTVTLTAYGEPCIIAAAGAPASGWIIGASVIVDNAPAGSYRLSFGLEYGWTALTNADWDTGDLGVGSDKTITVMSYVAIPGPYNPNDDDNYMLYLHFEQKTGGSVTLIDHNSSENWSNIWGMRVF